MRRSSRLLLFGLAALLLAASILYSRAMRRAYLAEVLRFVPKESEIVVVTGDIESLWGAVDQNFGEVIRDPGEEENGGLAGLFADWREALEERGVPVSALADLERYGIDVGRGVIVSWDNVPTETGPLAIVDVHDRDAFSNFFSALYEPDDRDGVPLEGTETTVIESEDALLAFPEPDVATVLFAPESPLVLRRSLADTRQNLVHARENDALYDGVRRNLGRPLGSGAVLYGYWQSRALGPLEEVIAVVRLGDRMIEVDAGLAIKGGGLRALDDLKTPAPTATPWTSLLPSTTAAAVFLVDDAASKYLGLAALSDEIEAAMEEEYGGILGELRDAPSLGRLLFAWTGYRDGLPEWVLGVWADPETLDRIVDDVQIRRREERDRMILEGAVEAYREKAGATALPTLSDLATSGLIFPEPHDLFDRYPIVEGTEEPERTVLTAADLDHPIYRRSFDGWTLEYLLPAVTENDLRYDPGLVDQDPELVRRDRYRLTALVMDGVLWIASDSRELEELALRSRVGTNGLDDSAAFATAKTTWHGREKIRGFIDVDRLTILGLLSPESRVQEQFKTVLLDLQNHPVMAFELDSHGLDDRVSLTVQLFHRTAMVAR